MRTTLTLGLALVLVAGALTGCGKKSALMDPVSTSGSSSLEEAAVTSTLSQTPGLIEDGVTEDPSQVSISAGSTGTLAAIHPLSYWRLITGVDRHFEFAFADTDTSGRPTTARVTVYKYLAGRFNILAAGAPDSTASDTPSVVHKPLADLWVRHLLLKRVRLGSSDRTEWRVAATSGVKVTSFDPRSARSAPVFGSTRILSLRVQATGVDTTIDDPLALFRLRGVLKFDAGDAVTLTAATAANDDVVVLMWGGMKFRFRNNGDGTHTGVFHLPMMGGLGHVGVNALAHGTLFDDTAPYRSQAWVLPYQVKPSLLAEFMP